MTNKFFSIIKTAQAGDPKAPINTTAYLDTAAELSKVDRKNHVQVAANGKPLVYDLLITVSTPQGANTGNNGILAMQTSTAPNNWQTRNAVRMAHFLREELRAEAGVQKGSIGKYAKNLRLNLNSAMKDLAYSIPGGVSTSSSQRMYAVEDITTTIASGGTDYFNGGTWDYSQLSVFVESITSGVTQTDNFYLHVCGGHSGGGSQADPWDSVAVIQAYNERRQTVLDESTLTPGGDTQFIDNNSPFFRIPEQDVSEDAYVQLTLDEQDNPPYDRSIGGGAGDSMALQIADWSTLPDQVTEITYRVQAPLGLVKFDMKSSLAGAAFAFEIECLGTYEM